MRSRSDRFEPIDEPLIDTPLRVTGRVTAKSDYTPLFPLGLTITVTLEDLPMRAPVDGGVRDQGSGPVLSAGSSRARSASADDAGPIDVDPDGPTRPEPAGEPEVFDRWSTYISTDAGGYFESARELSPRLRRSVAGGARCTVELAANIPGAGGRTVVATAGRGKWFDVVSELTRELSDIVYRVDFEGLLQFAAFVRLSPDATTSAYFSGGEELELELHYQRANPVAVPGMPHIRRAAPEIASAPMIVGATGTLFAHVFPGEETLHDGEHHYEVRHRARRIMRTPPFRGEELRNGPAAASAFTTGTAARIEVEVLSSELGSPSEREFVPPVLIIEGVRLTLEDGRVRVRAEVGAGTGGRVKLLTLGTIDAWVRLAPHPYSDLPYSESQLDALFDVTVETATFDALPGTDLDDLPAWVYVAMAPSVGVGPGVGAATAEAIEAAVMPVARESTRAQVVARLAERARETKEQEWEETLEGVEGLTEEERRILDRGFWFELIDVDINPSRVHLESFAGVWTTLALASRLAG
jgi:hypothetical protein